MKTVFIDLDGVLFDLHTALVAFTGIELPMEDRSKLFKSYLPAFVAVDGFAGIPVLENAYTLVEGLTEIKNCSLAILTSGGSFYTPRSDVAKQKKDSVDANFPALKDIPFCFTSSGASKSHLANKDAFLIDDHIPNIEKFIKAGGNGVIYHQSEVLVVLEQVRQFCNA